MAGGWSDDFAKEPLSRQAFFIHEMAHVWQAQKGGRFYLPLMRHPFCRYRFELKPGKPFSRYGIEQQAEIVRTASSPTAELRSRTFRRASCCPSRR